MGAEGFREVFTDERLRGIAWFTLWQATVSTRADARDRPPRRVCALALPLLREVDGARARDRSVRAPDRGRRRRVQPDPAAPLRPHGLGDPDRARLLQLRGRRPSRRRALGEPRPAARGERVGAGCVPLAVDARDRPAAARSSDRGRAASIVFLFTFTSFGVVLLLGGPRHSTLEVEIYRQTAELLDLQVAAALALVQLVAVVALLLVTTRMQSRLAVQRRMRRRDETTITVRTRGQRALLGVNFAVMLVLLGLPLLALVERSFAVPGGHGLTWYRQLGSTGTSRPVRASDRGDPELARVRDDRDRDRHGDRRIGLDRDRRTARRAPGSTSA